MQKIELDWKPKIKNLEIHHFYDLDAYLQGLFPKFFLFTKEEVLTGTLLTDGEIQEGSVWVDKNPSFFDSDYQAYSRIQRHEFFVEKASYVFIEKQFLKEGRIVRDLYLSRERKDSIEEFKGIELSITESEKIKIKKR